MENTIRPSNMHMPELMRQIAQERDYFSRLRASVYAHAIPTLIVREGYGVIERVYPDYVNEAIDTINKMESAYMSRYDDILLNVKSVNVLGILQINE